MKIKNNVVTAPPKISRRVKALPITRSASSRSPRPRQIEHRGAPPVPHRLAKPMMMDTMGMVSPSPVSARCPGSRPRYIRSTTLYSTLISWAAVMGTARDMIFFAMLP